MRKNEYTSLDQFTSQYTGEWSPSEGHWYGLDFLYKGKEYKFNTGSMFNSENVKVNIKFTKNDYSIFTNYGKS